MAAITRWSTGSAVCSAVLRSPPLPSEPLLALRPANQLLHYQRFAERTVLGGAESSRDRRRRCTGRPARAVDDAGRVRTPAPAIQHRLRAACGMIGYTRGSRRAGLMEWTQRLYIGTPSSFTPPLFRHPASYRITSHARKPYQSRTTFRVGATARSINEPPGYARGKPGALGPRIVTRKYFPCWTRATRYGE